MKIITVFISMLLVHNAATSRAQGTWIQKADFGGTKRTAATGFSIGTKGYLGTGYNKTGLPQKDFWQYDQETDTWMQSADFGGNQRLAAVAFSIDGKGYVGTGLDSAFIIKKDFWEYDPLTNTWTQIADFAGTPRYEAVAFAAGGKGYVGTGFDWSLFPSLPRRFMNTTLKRIVGSRLMTFPEARVQEQQRFQLMKKDMLVQVTTIILITSKIFGNIILLPETGYRLLTLAEHKDKDRRHFR